MRRLRAALRLEVRVQVRAGFVAVGAFMAAVWVVILRLLPAWSLSLATPLVIFLDLATVGYFLMAALVLYDRGEATLLALLVSPLRFWEYLAARLAVLAALALALALPVALAGVGAAFDPGILVIGVVLTAVLTSLAGFVIVAPFRSISDFLLPSGLPLTAMGLPLVDQLGWWPHPTFALLPTHGALLLLRAAFVPVATEQIIGGVAAALAWIAALAWAAGWAFERHIAARRGGG